MKPEDVVPGDWFLVEYGLPLKIYVAEKYATRVRFSWSRALASNETYLSYEELLSGEYLGRGKRRWWWRWLPIRDFLCPFTEPIR